MLYFCMHQVESACVVHVFQFFLTSMYPDCAYGQNGEYYEITFHWPPHSIQHILIWEELYGEIQRIFKAKERANK